MLKLELDQTDSINFKDLDVGETFLVQTDDYVWVGMKVAYLMDYEPKYYIMNLSSNLNLSKCNGDDVGELYSDWENKDYKIIKILDLVIKEN